MKKPLKVLSSATLVAMMATTTLTPVAYADAPKPEAKEISDMVFNVDGKLGKVELSHYLAGLARGIVNPEEVQHVTFDNGEVHAIDMYLAALARTGTEEKAIKFLSEKGKPVTDTVYPATLHKDGTITIDEQPEDRLNETFFYNVA